jgi:hypothetical protein
MGLGRRESSHDTALSRKQGVGDYPTTFMPGQRVMTVDGIPGIIDGIDYSPQMGEQYEVTLENGAGHGNYAPSQLSPMAGHIASGAHLASDDYPELTEILRERPDIALPTHVGSLQTTAATRADFQFEHEDTGIGGVKFGPKQHLRAIHPETGEQAGKLTYFAPKRKGSPVTMDSLTTSHPGAGSALMDEMESRHPGSRVVHDQPMSKGKPHYDHPDYGKPTDWESRFPSLPDQVHRGMSVRLEGSDARAVTSGNGSAAEHGELLKQHLQSTGPLGMHWSTSEDIPRNFAHRNIRDPRQDVPVIVHADRPEAKDIETRPQVLKDRGVWSHDYEHGDAEVPVRKGRKLNLRGISWKPDAPHPEADADGWVHHTFEGTQHKASLIVVGGDDDGDYRMQHKAPTPGEGNNHLGEMGYAGEHVPIYRSAPHGVHTISPGDWVSTNADYAHQHGMHGTNSEKDWPVLTAHVPAEHVWTDHNDENEQGYHGPPIHEADFHHPELGEVSHSDAHAAQDEHREMGIHLLSEKPAPETHTGAAVQLSPEDHAFVHDSSKPIHERAQRVYQATRDNSNHLYNDDHEDAQSAADDADVDAYDLNEDHGKDPQSLTHVVLHGHEGNGGLHHGISWGGADEAGAPLYPKEYTHHHLVDGSHMKTAGAFNGMDGGFEDVSDEDPNEDIVTHGSFDPYDLLTVAAVDPVFRFHITASWADVQRKAKRIRSEGKVRITLASDGLVIGEVQGDHHVYETGVQRFPGSKHSVATYTCGCKWGAYHWGANDDFSRFAGRMCSHALALQYEASSRGMFGRDVKEDGSKPDWVPKKIVLRYDIDEGDNVMARSSSLEVTPLIALAHWAEAQGDDQDEFHLALVCAGLNVTAAVSSPWGEPSAPRPNYTPGPTKPRDPSENPASAGWASQGDPDNWGSIEGNQLGDRIAALEDDAFLFEGSIPEEVAQSDDPQASVPGLHQNDADPISASAAQEGPPRPSGPKGGPGGDMPPGHPGMPEHDELKNGTEATLHMEPEGALPFTDGDGPDLSDDESLTPPHTASVEDTVAAFQATAGYLMAGGPSTAPTGDLGDIAAAAKAHLAKTAVKDYSSAEQAAIINEGSNGVRAANLDRLDIADTHYALIDSGEEDEGSWLN